MANLYLREDLVATSVGETVELVGAEARHAVAVSRTRVGDELLIGDGRGLLVRGRVTAADAQRVSMRVDTVEHVPASSPRVLLAQALAKGDRDELAIQAATELGVDAVIPWAAERSIVRWSGPKVDKGIDRWRSIVREATKQSIRAHLPVVEELSSTAQLAGRAADSQVLILEPSATDALSGIRFDERDIVLVVGPEGGIAPGELDRFRAAGATLVRLGDTVLRTSTAGPAALAALAALRGRW
jgi:16S rRNA (uracil1498-N3)-methyltransferase